MRLETKKDKEWVKKDYLRDRSLFQPILWRNKVAMIYLLTLGNVVDLVSVLELV